MDAEKIRVEIVSELEEKKLQEVNQDIAFATYYNSQVQRRNDCIDECIATVNKVFKENDLGFNPYQE